MNLTSTQRRVLENLRDDKPMWEGVTVFNRGAGIPAVVTMLMKHRLIASHLTSGGFRITEKGQEILKGTGTDKVS